MQVKTKNSLVGSSIQRVRSRCIEFSTLCFATIALVMVVTATERIATANDTEFILLKSGKVLEGTVSTSRKGTRIDFPKGEYILVPSPRVEKSFESMRDLVKYKTAITPLSSQDQSRLLDWLLEHEEYNMAAAQLVECQRANIPIDVADWTKRIGQKKDPATKKSALPNNKEISTKYVANSGYDSKAAFMNKVQRHFVIGCGLSGCHDSVSKTPFKLYSSFGKPLDQTQSSKNFSVASQYLQTAEKAKVLQEMVTTPHGRLSAAVYPRPSKPYLAITTWINATRNSMPRRGQDQKSDRLTSKTPPLAESSSNSRPKSLPVLAPTKVPPAGKQPFSSRMAGAKSNPATAQSGSESTDSFGSLSGDLNTMFSEFKPRDEFDPEIFNRLQKEKSMGAVKDDNQPGDPTESASSNQVPSRLISPESSKSKN